MMLIEKAIELTGKKINNVDALEVGQGHNPVINQFKFKKHFYLDKETSVGHDNYLKGDLCQYEFTHKFDLIYESLCWHENTGKRWKNFLASVFDLLKPGGVFISRHAILNKKMVFSEAHHFFNKTTNELYCLKGERPIRFVPPSIEIEGAVSEIGLNIIYLMAPLNKKVIIDRNDSIPRQTDPDLLELICRKNN